MQDQKAYAYPGHADTHQNMTYQNIIFKIIKFVYCFVSDVCSNRVFKLGLLKHMSSTVPLVEIKSWL